jgi:hypothetical protein
MWGMALSFVRATPLEEESHTVPHRRDRDEFPTDTAHAEQVIHQVIDHLVTVYPWQWSLRRANPIVLRVEIGYPEFPGVHVAPPEPSFVGSWFLIST